MQVTAKRFGLVVLIYALAFAVFSLRAHGTTPAKVSTQVTAQTPTSQKELRHLYAVFDTTMGTFKVLLNFRRAPNTVANFVGLAEGTKAWNDPKTKSLIKKPLYNGLEFFRVRKDFIVQSGDPLNNGNGGPGFTIKDEFHPDLRHDRPGIVSMLRSAPNTEGSQFMITFKDEKDFDNVYPVFGIVVSGLNVVKKISEARVNLLNEHPLKPIYIKSVKIIREY